MFLTRVCLGLIVVYFAAANPTPTNTGPADINNTYPQLKSEDDVSATMNALTAAMEVDDSEEAICALTKLLKKESFDDCISLIKDITKKEQLGDAVESLQNSSGQKSLVYIINQLYQLTKTQDLASANDRLYTAFQLDIINIFERVKLLSKNDNPLKYLSSLLEATNQDNIVDACADIRSSTTRNMTTLDFMDELQNKTGLNLVDLFKKTIEGSGKTTLGEAWAITKANFGVDGIFQDIKLCNSFTHFDLITKARTILTVTNSSIFQEAQDLLCPLTGTKNLYEAMAEIRSRAHDDDMVLFLQKLSSLTDQNTVQGSIDYMKRSTGKNNFLDCLEFLAQQSGEAGIMSALDKIKENQQFYIKTESTSSPQ